MSIIIRLQNLPLEANSLDIRRYFEGLTIPGGGVHIVGGEQGDAFIAFASDEDARQAMSRDGGMIKSSRIKLLLSSRTEMQSVVEQARQKTAALSAVNKLLSQDNILKDALSVTQHLQLQLQQQQQQQQQQQHQQQQQQQQQQQNQQQPNQLQSQQHTHQPQQLQYPQPPQQQQSQAPLLPSQQQQQQPAGQQQASNPQASNLVLFMKGLPWANCNDRDVIAFFGNIPVVDCLVESDARGKPTGNAFVQFPTDQDYQAALKLNMKHMGKRYIELFASSRDEMLRSTRLGDSGQAGLGSGDLANPNLALQRNGQTPMGAPQPYDNIQQQTFCISVRGLSPTIINRDLTDYFKEGDIQPYAIHIMLTPNGQNAGEAFVEFLDAHHHRTALQRDGQFLGGSQISVRPVPYEHMRSIIGAPQAPLPMLPQIPMQAGVGNLQQTPQIQPGMLRAGVGVAQPMGPASLHLQQPMQPMLPMQNSQSMMLRQGGNGMYNNSGNGDSGHYGRNVNNNNNNNIDDDDVLERRAMKRRMNNVNNNNSMPMNDGSTMRGGDPALFADKRCVLAVSNIPYRASSDDIKAFFEDFGVTENCIQRRYNAKNQPTADAKVAFPSPDEASRALRMMNKKHLCGRVVFLKAV